MEPNTVAPEVPGRRKPRKRHAYRFLNNMERLSEFEERIFEQARNRGMNENDFLAIRDDGVEGAYLIILSDPLHPRNNWSCLLQKVLKQEGTCYGLAAEIPMTIKREWEKNGFPPKSAIEWGAVIIKNHEVLQRKLINPLDVDWRRNDVSIARQMGCSRERVRRLRLECSLWSEIDWDKTDAEIARIMGSRLAQTFGKSSVRGCQLSRVSTWRTRKGWLHENRNHFRRSEDFRQQNTDSLVKLKQMDTSVMTLEEIARAIHKSKEWVEHTLAKLGRPCVPVAKKFRGRWHWERVKEGEWRTKTISEICKLVTDDQGNHPSIMVANAYRWWVKHQSP